MSDEIWKPVVGFEKSYEVSNLGRVRSLTRSWPQMSRHGSTYTHTKTGRLLRPGTMTSGHLTVAIGSRNSRLVHHLVLGAFVGPRPAGTECRHLDGNPRNNRLENLKWDTRGNNGRDKKWHAGCTRYTLTPSDVSQIKAALIGAYVGLGRELAARFNVHESTISAIKHGRYHVDVE